MTVIVISILLLFMFLLTFIIYRIQRKKKNKVAVMPVDYSEKKIIGDMSQRLALMNYMEENEVVSFSPETRRNKKIVERLDLELMAVTSEQKDYDREIPLSNAKYEVETEEDKDMDLNLR